ncbi:hypothetical protein ZWY2020_000221 [Hordeum vulgare]|nr:hypothetical protein ZWY2020_000221 [Hordeum vulgare]
MPLSSLAPCPCGHYEVEDGGRDPVTGQSISTTIDGKNGDPKRVSCLSDLIKVRAAVLETRGSPSPW